jgi:hypothetical protein
MLEVLLLVLPLLCFLRRTHYYSQRWYQDDRRAFQLYCCFAAALLHYSTLVSRREMSIQSIRRG